MSKALTHISIKKAPSKLCADNHVSEAGSLEKMSRGDHLSLLSNLSLTLFLLNLTAVFASAQETVLPQHLKQAVHNSDRPKQDLVRDPFRKPAQVMLFFEVQPGQRVVELMAGSGYYAELLARAVGSKGQVWAQNNAFVLERFAEAKLTKRLQAAKLTHLKRLDQELDDLDLPQELDAVFMILFYHDTYWQNVDRNKMNDAVFNALKPGGIFGIVDHHAEAGSGSRDVKTIHRVDIELVKKELLAAGFQLESESDLLRHSDDPRKQNVFEQEIRGRTDRFVLKFRKPH